MANPFQVEENLRKLLDPHPAPKNFREALSAVSRHSREDVVRLWLTEGIPFAFRTYPAAYEEMRTWLGRRLGVCPKEVTVVGSARIGFSLPETKFGRPFDQESDLDLSIVSGVLFGSLAETFATWKLDYSSGIVQPRHERERMLWNENLKVGERNLTAGFFDANKLPTFDRYPLIQQIQQTMWALTKKLEVTPNIPSPRSASVRVYRTWKNLVERVSLNLYTALVK